MRDVFETMATISGLRDRLALMSAIARLVFDVVKPEAVTLWRRQCDEGVEQWLVVQRFAASDRQETAGPQRLAALPVAQAAWVGVEAQPHAACPHTTFHALRSGSCLVGAVEVSAPGGLDGAAARQLRAIVRFFAHLRSLIEENECDALTGLLNRKTFDEAFARIAFGSDDEPPMADPSRGPAGGCWSLAVIDIDHFKRINDTHGHLIGDEVLLMLSQRLRATLRADDPIYRFGGEEFVVLLRTPDEQGALKAFERLRCAVADHDFPRVGRITVSLGCTHVRPGDTPNDAFGRADQAVYWVKQNGRNQARAHEALVAEGQIAAAESAGGVEFF